MKKIFKITALALIGIVTLTACNKNFDNIAGYKDVQNAKSLYAALGSGHLQIKDNDSGIVTQDFKFKYDGDTLVYSYIGTDGEKTYYEYNNGTELDYTDSDSTEWKFYTQANEEFYSYNRATPHPLASETAISINPDSITDGTVTENADGTKTIAYNYDISMLNSYASSLSEVGTLKKFSTTLSLSADGYCTELSQLATLEDAEGEFEVNYTMTISEMNQIEKVERPKASWES